MENKILCDNCNDVGKVYNEMGETMDCEMCQFVDGLPRPEVVRFASDMEQRLRENDHRETWHDPGTNLLETLVAAVKDLLESVASGENANRVTIKAADVANISMFIADMKQRKEAAERVRVE